MSKRRLSLWMSAVIGVIGFPLGMLSVAADSIKFDLRIIGESVYEAHRRSGSWPAGPEDLAGTSYLAMPYREMSLERRHFVLVPNRDLASDPHENAQRVLAYDNTSMLSRFSRVYVCRGDLRVEWIARTELERLVGKTR